MTEPKDQPALVIQCPNVACDSVLDNIMLCELMPSMWSFKVKGNMIIADTSTQDNGEYISSSRHLYCTCCGTEWTIPTLAEVDWR